MIFDRGSFRADRTILSMTEMIAITYLSFTHEFPTTTTNAVLGLSKFSVILSFPDNSETVKNIVCNMKA